MSHLHKNLANEMNLSPPNLCALDIIYVLLYHLLHLYLRIRIIIMPVGDISPIGIVKVNKSITIADEMWAWVSVRHANFMASSHHQIE